VDMTVERSMPLDSKLPFARLDPVTYLPNRQQFFADIEEGRVEDCHCVMVTLTDAAHFNGILRALGHDYADDFIRVGAARIRGAVPPALSVYHASVLSFCFVVQGDPEPLIAAVIDSFTAPLLTGGIPISTRAGVGVTAARDLTAADMLRTSLAAAQDSRKAINGWSRYDSRADTAHRRGFFMLSQLSAAMAANNQLSLHFQPLARQCGAITGFEALIRWDHPVHGRLSPDQFIPLAEESGLIIPLSAWILHAACAEAASWRDGLKISVNLSPVQFEHPGLVELVRTSLAETGLRAERLTLEITEGVLISNYVRAMGVLQEIASLGVAIALDDFGTGYSSLSYLHEFPLSEIKIDKSFATSLGLSRRSESIVRSVIELGHALGLRVVVEGVERHDQLGFIEQTNCDLVQGFLIGRPLNGIDSRKLIDDTGRGSPVPEDCPVI